MSTRGVIKTFNKQGLVEWFRKCTEFIFLFLQSLVLIETLFVLFQVNTQYKEYKLGNKSKEDRAIIGKMFVLVLQHQNKCIVLTRSIQTFG